MPFTQEATDAGQRLAARPWWDVTDDDAGQLARLSDGQTTDYLDPVVITCTRQQAAQMVGCLGVGAIFLDGELAGEQAATALDLSVLVGDQLFPVTEENVQDATAVEPEPLEA